MSSDDPRPVKRARKKTVSELEEAESPPRDHIFVADGAAVKRQQAKKPPLSCAECRRLKLKCDRAFPCKSCSKRGCAAICPEGVLVSGKGTRFILANTEQLHTKIGEMSDRIKALEDALREVQISGSPHPHPLLAPDLLAIKSAMALYGDTQTGSQQNSHHQQSPPLHGDNNGSASRLNDVHANHDIVDDTNSRITSEIARLSYEFPFSDTLSPETCLALRSRLRRELPIRTHASYLWEQVRQHAVWQYNPHPDAAFMHNLLRHVYESPLEDLGNRRLALMFMIVAVGHMVDVAQPCNRITADRFYQLARASLSEVSVLENVDTDAILVLFYMTWYLLEFSDRKNAANYAWGLMGLAAKLAQSIGLHRDVVRSKVFPEEIERRRALFWELLHLDARLSLSISRPPSLFHGHSDCPRPSYIPDEGFSSSDSRHHYQEWRHSFFVHCLDPSLKIISSPTPDYTTVIELDRKIRDFYVPPLFQDSERSFSRALTMQKASLSMAFDSVLLQLHRSFFANALCGPVDCEHKYAPSLVAVVLSASRMIATMDWLYHRDPELSVRTSRCWSNTFSAAAALCLLVSQAPFTCLCPAVLQDLERARVLFTAAREQCPQVMQTLPLLEKMIDKANHVYVQWAATPGDGPPVGGKQPDVPRSEGQPKEAFQRTHPDLLQCIVEVHQRAQVLFPVRKPCRCLATSMSSLPARVSVLPELYTDRMSYGVLAAGGVPSASFTGVIAPESRVGITDSSNFDFGALESSWSDQGWMAWF